MSRGRKARRRGHEWEREIAGDLSDLDLVEAERVLQEPRDGLVGDVRSNLPLSIQAKCSKQPSVWKALEEAKEAAADGQHPVAAVRRRHGQGVPSDRVAVLPWSDLLEIVGLLRGQGVW